jgi:hypothetical protein
MSGDEVLCLEGIRKCDEFLKGWRGGLTSGDSADKMPPDDVARSFRRIINQIHDGGGEPCADYHLVIFWANAKQGFIMRLAGIREAEYAVPVA